VTEKVDKLMEAYYEKSQKTEIWSGILLLELVDKIFRLATNSLHGDSRFAKLI